MFRISEYIRELDSPGASPSRRATRSGVGGPVVVWNLTRRCNLSCRHCYSASSDKAFSNELTTEQAFAVLDDLRAFGVPALILSGGEPLLREDGFLIARRARELGFFIALSSNGTLMDDAVVATIAETGFDYVGVSVDGLAANHDRFRGRAGAFADALAGLRRCRAQGIKVGLRFTMTRDNCGDLPSMLSLLDGEGIDRFYFSHLNYAGRGNRNRGDDTQHLITRHAVDALFAECLRLHRQGTPKEFVTGNNDADGVHMLSWVRERFPHRVEHIHAKLRQWGGNSTGVNIANIDNTGDVHPDTMWWHHRLGNVLEQPFSRIWSEASDPLMTGLRQRPRPVKGRCGVCRHLDICNGNTRVRAQRAVGDPWAEDPACYLDDHEIGRTDDARVAAAVGELVGD